MTFIERQKKMIEDCKKDISQLQEKIRQANEALLLYAIQADEYDIVLGAECYPALYPEEDFFKKVQNARNVFAFSYAEKDRDADCKLKIASRLDFFREIGKRAGKELLPFNPSADFSEVVLFFGFCPEDYPHQWDEGLAAATSLSQRKDTLVRFTNQTPYLPSRI